MIRKMCDKAVNTFYSVLLYILHAVFIIYYHYAKQKTIDALTI